MCATVIGIRQARDEAGRLQSVEQSDNCDGRNVKTVSKSDLIEASRLLELQEHGAPCASHLGNSGTQYFLAASSP
jgi:hypothetical protein